MKPKYIVFAFLLSVALYTYSQEQCYNPDLQCDTCSCPAIYDPVIGCDGAIYVNSCEAYIMGLTAWIPYLATDFIYINAPDQINKGESATLLIEHEDVYPAVVSYLWDHGDTADEIIVSPDSSTTYTVTVSVTYTFSFEDGSISTYEDNFTYNVNIKVIDPLDGINSPGKNNRLKIFPNPASTKVSIQSAVAFTYIQLMDFKGVIIKNLMVNSNSASIDISNLLPGVYFLKTDNNEVVRFVKI